jgi:hypothetical protein
VTTFPPIPLTACAPERRCPQLAMCARIRTGVKGAPPGRVDFSVMRSEAAGCLMFVDVRGIALMLEAA